MTKYKSTSDTLFLTICYFFVTLAMLICLLPLIHTLAVSFSSRASASAGLVTFFPVDFTTAAYRSIIRDKMFFRSFANSILRVGLGVPLDVLFCIIMAYPLSKKVKYFPQRNIYMWFMIFTMLFSGGLIPSYILMQKLRLMDSIWVLVLPSIVQPFNVILLMNFFRGIPDELDDSARIDGAGVMSVMWRIFVPLATPSIATITLFNFVGHWNSWFDGVIYMNKVSKFPLQTYIQQLIVQSNINTSLSFEEQRMLSEVSGKSFNAAKIFVTMVPLLIVYPFVQRHFVAGIVLGAVKG